MDSDHHNEKSLVQVLTLEDTINSFGDEGKTIHYLKVDVEGHELKAMHDWLDSGVLEVVQQIGLELLLIYSIVVTSVSVIKLQGSWCRRIEGGVKASQSVAL